MTWLLSWLKILVLSDGSIFTLSFSLSYFIFSTFWAFDNEYSMIGIVYPESSEETNFSYIRPALM